MTTAAKLSAQGTSIASLKGVSLMDPEGLQFEIPGGFLDLSRHLLNEQTLPTLLEHAQSVQLEEARDAMFLGERINASEDRSVLHVALRGGLSKTIEVDGEDPTSYAAEQLERMLAFADAVRGGQLLTSNGAVFH